MQSVLLPVCQCNSLQQHCKFGGANEQAATLQTAICPLKREQAQHQRDSTRKRLHYCSAKLLMQPW
jgi:hypothetical protein